MKKIKKMLCLVLTAIIVISLTAPASTENVEAEVTAKSLVSSALKYMKSYDTISFSYNLESTCDGNLWHRTGMVVSDSKVNHGFYLDSSESLSGWEEYSKKDKVYRKGASGEWSTDTVTNYNSKSVDSYTYKKYLEYVLGHLKNMKITSRGTNSYTVTAKPSVSGTHIKKVTLTINKKEKCVTNVKFTYNTYKKYYLNSSNTYTIKNQVITWSNICYGKGTIKVPGGL